MVRVDLHSGLCLKPFCSCKAEALPKPTDVILWRHIATPRQSFSPCLYLRLRTPFSALVRPTLQAPDKAEQVGDVQDVVKQVLSARLHPMSSTPSHQIVHIAPVASHESLRTGVLAVTVRGPAAALPVGAGGAWTGVAECVGQHALGLRAEMTAVGQGLILRVAGPWLMRHSCKADVHGCMVQCWLMCESLGRGFCLWPCASRATPRGLCTQPPAPVASAWLQADGYTVVLNTEPHRGRPTGLFIKKVLDPIDQLGSPLHGGQIPAGVFPDPTHAAPHAAHAAQHAAHAAPHAAHAAPAAPRPRGC